MNIMTAAIKKTANVVLKMDEAIVSFAKRRLDKRMHRIVDVYQTQDKIEYLQEMRQGWIKKKGALWVISFPYSLPLIIIDQGENETIKAVTYDIISCLAYISLLLIFVFYKSISWLNFSSIQNAVISMFVWVFPLRIFIACLAYKISYIIRDFMAKKPEDLAIDIDKEKERIKTIYAKGEK